MGITKKEGPACGLTRRELLEAIAAGESLSSIEKAWGMKYNTIHNWVKNWGVKGITPDKARELLEPMAAESETESESSSIAPETGDRLPEAQEPAIAPEVKLTDNEDGEIEYLRRGVDHWKSKSVEAVALAGESAEKYTSEIAKLKAENEDLAAERDDFRLAAEDWESKIDMFASAILERDVEISRLKVELDAITAPAQVAVAAESADPVNHPAHYTAGKVECIDALEAATDGLVGIEALCTGNAIKYLWRWKRKGGVEDLRKAQWYLARLIAAKSQQI